MQGNYTNTGSTLGTQRDSLAFCTAQCPGPRCVALCSTACTLALLVRWCCLVMAPWPGTPVCASAWTRCPTPVCACAWSWSHRGPEANRNGSAMFSSSLVFSLHPSSAWNRYCTSLASLVASSRAYANTVGEFAGLERCDDMLALKQKYLRAPDTPGSMRGEFW